MNSRWREADAGPVAGKTTTVVKLNYPTTRPVYTYHQMTTTFFDRAGRMLPVKLAVSSTEGCGLRTSKSCRFRLLASRLAFYWDGEGIGTS